MGFHAESSCPAQYLTADAISDGAGSPANIGEAAAMHPFASFAGILLSHWNGTQLHNAVSVRYRAFAAGSFGCIASSRERLLSTQPIDENYMQLE